jgi:hypothetical protein
MNIFYLDNDPVKCAEMHVDKHVVKMILEYAQLLSTAHRVLDGVLTTGLSQSGRKQQRYVLDDQRQQMLYSATHINHPSAIWCRQSDSNYIWLSKLLLACCKEYTYRYGKVHKCEQSGLVQELFSKLPNNIPRQKNFTGPTPAMPDDCKVLGDSLASYHKYYINNKAHLANWKNRSKPNWYIT